jgi:anti-sigma B factor antagonist
MIGFTVTVNPSQLSRRVTVFTLNGHLDAVTVIELEAKFREQMSAASYRWVVDMAGLEYISSAGLGSFIGVLEEVRSHGGDILFVGLTAKTEKIFQVLGFTRIFRLFPSEREAVEEFERPK